MTLSLYSIWLPDPATSRAADDIQADIRSAGLLEQGGLVAGKVSVEDIDLTVTGQFRLGEPLSRVLATELESLAASAYGNVPLYDPDTQDRKRGYKEVQAVDVNPAHPTTEGAYEYTVALSSSGTKQTHWRAVRTNVETVSTGLATGSAGQIAIDAQSRKARWFSPADGTEAATVQASGSGAFGAVEFYDPGEPTFDNPTLIYEVDFDREPLTDAIVYDDRGLDKTLTFVEGDAVGGFQYDTAQYDTVQYAGRDDTTASQWPHVFDVTHEFDGRPVVDTGRLRVRFDETAGEIVAFQAPDGVYTETTISHGDYELFDADVEAIGPARVVVYSEWEDTASGDIDRAVLAFPRGASELVVRVPENESSVPSALESVLSPIASDQTDDPQAAQDLVRRAEVK